MSRTTWKSKFGFLMAAAGSAIGLGNIVFFPANAYRFGAGAFYLPYLIALILLGLPIIIMELGIGRVFRKGFPSSMNEVAGFKGEMTGWFAILNSSVITMYYITILGWVLGMLIRSFSSLWTQVAVPEFGIEAGTASIGISHFFSIISSPGTVALVFVVWVLNIFCILKGTKTIEKIVKVLVPSMWVFMIIMIVRGLTLPGGFEGMLLLFTPDMSILSSLEVWKGAFSQIFFTLSLGFGIMTTYASYLPKKSDIVNDGLSVTFMNCTFEMIAGIAIFTLLFAFSISPKASTLGMMFFVMPEGIAQFPGVTVQLFGILFFTLLLSAGLTSSMSLLETVASAVIDKFAISRKKALGIIFGVGLSGSIMFSLPFVVDPELNASGTLGLTLLDFFDHWAFGYGLLLTGLVQTILISWIFGAERMRSVLNEYSKWKIGKWFVPLVKFVIPAIITVLLVSGIVGEFSGLYGHSSTGNIDNLHIFALIAWILFTVGGSFILAKMKERRQA